MNFGKLPVSSLLLHDPVSQRVRPTNPLSAPTLHSTAALTQRTINPLTHTLTHTLHLHTNVGLTRRKRGRAASRRENSVHRSGFTRMQHRPVFFFLSFSTLNKQL